MSNNGRYLTDEEDLLEKILIELKKLNDTLTAELPAYDDDTAAGVAGLVAGDKYQTTGDGAAPLNVAGIQMIKQ